MDKNFEKNWRRKQELKGQPIADAIYKSISWVVSVTRENGSELDIKHAIDAKLTTNTGQVLTLQEKFLSCSCAKYKSVTIEYEQNQHTGERGDWFKLAPQLYFVGYFNKDDTSFEPYVLLNTTNLVIATNSGAIKWNLNANKDGHALASFKWCKMDDLPDDVVLDSKGTKHDKS